MVRRIEAVEAQRTLDDLLDLVQRGEEVVITRHGTPVARLVPEATVRDTAKAQAAVDRIRARATCRKADPITAEEWASFRDEGRR